MKTTYFALVVLAFVVCAHATYESEQLLPGICTLPMDAGTTCSHEYPSTRYTYDLRIRRCISFAYNGCVGNANNFDTLLECQKTCKEDITTTQAPTTVPSNTNRHHHHYTRVSAAQSTNTTVTPTIPSPDPRCLYCVNPGLFCDKREPSYRYGFSTFQGQCFLFQYNGCGGNTNNFSTIKKCQKTCK